MNKTYKYTLTAHEKKEISFDTGVARLAIANGDGVDGSTTVIMSEITKQHSGDLVSFIDGADAPFADFIANIVAVQSGSGDPSPTNVRPISGFSTVNVGDISDTEKVQYFKGLLDGTYGYVNLGSLTWTLDSSYSGMPGHYRFNATLTTLKSSNTLRFSVSSMLNIITWEQANNGAVGLIYNAASDNILRVESTDYSVAEDFKVAVNGVYLIYELETPTTPTITPTEFNTLVSAFGLQGWIVQITMPDEAGIVGGGSVDIVNGKIMVNKVGIKGVTVARIGTTGSGVRYVDTTSIYADLVANTPTISDRYKQINTSTTAISGQFRVYNGQFTIYDNRFTDLDTAQSLLNDVEFYYELATPITYQLTPTEIHSLLGINNVWADCGPVDVRYFVQSTQPMIDYIDDKTIVYFDAQEDFSTYDISLVGATSTDIKNCLLANKNANIVIRVKRYSTILLYYLREYSPNYFAEFASHAVIFDAEGTKSMRIDYLRLDLTQETSDFTDDHIILPTS